MLVDTGQIARTAADPLIKIARRMDCSLNTLSQGQLLKGEPESCLNANLRQGDAGAFSSVSGL